ncbi:hypothetical protein CCACVL1_29633 [Corchorus capsularis]|uniref:Uncharacterized protein n=1 Tax=Corchorus capsularis TaxID=210143 RepID=A0A1R3G106_COCAP|nr:hypothetical protein CCACVL1_29633 [Corchorus capsularis]
MEGVVKVIPNHELKLHTTRSWDFIRFTQDTVGAKPEGDHCSHQNLGAGKPKQSSLAVSQSTSSPNADESSRNFDYDNRG